MFFRVEVSLRPELQDPRAGVLLENVQRELPELHAKIRWARILDVYWMDLPLSREEVIPALSEIFWDRVTQWIFTGNLIPAASGKSGGVNDLAEYAPHRPGKFWGIETRFRGGVTDEVARVASEAFEIVLRKKIPGMQVAHGQLILLEGPELSEENLSHLSREVLCNEIVETWSLLDEVELRKSDRFHQERIRRDLPRSALRAQDSAARLSWRGMNPLEAERQAQQLKLGLTRNEAVALASMLGSDSALLLRKELGLPEQPTRLEAEWIARWLTQSRAQRITHAPIQYKGMGADLEIPSQWSSFAALVDQRMKEASPKGWIRPDPRTGRLWMQMESEELVCHQIAVSTDRLPFLPEGETTRVLSEVAQKSLQQDPGVQWLGLSTGLFASEEKDSASPSGLPVRRVVREVTDAVEQGVSSFGVPLVGGTQLRLPEFSGKAVFLAGMTGVLPSLADRHPLMDTRGIEPGDRLIFLGLPVSKRGVPKGVGSLSPDRDPALQSFQLTDVLMERRMHGVLSELRDLGGLRAVGTGECIADSLLDWIGSQRAVQGVKIDLERIPRLNSDVSLSDALFSSSECHRLLAISGDQVRKVLALAEQRGFVAETVGEFTQTHRLDFVMGQKWVAAFDLNEFFSFEDPEFSKALTPILAEWPESELASPSSKGEESVPFSESASGYLRLKLSSAEKTAQVALLRSCDQEGSGQTIVKPEHEAQVATAQSQFGPNDASVLRVSPRSSVGLAFSQATGVFPVQESVSDPYVGAQLVFDQILRRALAVGGEYGRPESMVAFSAAWIWPNPRGSLKLAGALARAGMGLKDASEAMGVPLIASTHHWTQQGDSHPEGVPPVLSLNGFARVRDSRQARSSDVKGAGDVIYLLGSSQLSAPQSPLPAIPDWELARKIYSWVGGETTDHVLKVRTLKDLGSGGLCVALVESLMARNLGAHIQLPKDQEPWTFCFGEGFHHFLVFCSESEALFLEESWSTHDLPFSRIGVVNATGKLEVKQGLNSLLRFEVGEGRACYSRETLHRNSGTHKENA